jgi:hypothetical protein
MPKKKKTGEIVLTEAEAEKEYEIARGFNLTREDGEVRFSVGKAKPHYVTEKEFSENEFKELIKQGALVPVLALEETLEGLEDPDLKAPEEITEDNG